MIVKRRKVYFFIKSDFSLVCEKEEEEVKAIDKGYLITTCDNPNIHLSQKLKIELEIFPGTISTTSHFKFDMLMNSQK